MKYKFILFSPWLLQSPVMQVYKRAGQGSQKSRAMASDDECWDAVAICSIARV